MIQDKLLVLSSDSKRLPCPGKVQNETERVSDPHPTAHKIQSMQEIFCHYPNPWIPIPTRIARSMHQSLQVFVFPVSSAVLMSDVRLNRPRNYTSFTSFPLQLPFHRDLANRSSFVCRTIQFDARGTTVSVCLNSDSVPEARPSLTATIVMKRHV